MITVRKSADRGHADHGWLDTRHTFSFADYFDPEYTQFRTLRVLNEDRVAGGQGFGLHSHRDMEIISYVVSGALEHKDSMGNRALMKAGDIQRISAGAGIRHSEYNGSATEPVHFLQIWIVPDERGVKPDYAQRSFGGVTPGTLQLVASKQGRDGSIPIHQDTEVFVAKLEAGGSLAHSFAAGRHGWLQLIAGEVKLNGTALSAGDGASISGEDRVEMHSVQAAHFLFFDLT